MGRGFEYHGIEGTVQFIKLVSGNALHPTEGIIEDTEFIRLAEWEVYGGFDGVGLIIW